MRCPNCGRLLEHVNLNADTPPWLCTPCARGWWKAEVDNGSHWEPETRSFGANTAVIMAMCESERGQQHAAVAAGGRG